MKYMTKLTDFGSQTHFRHVNKVLQKCECLSIHAILVKSNLDLWVREVSDPEKIPSYNFKYIQKYEEYQQTPKYENAQNNIVDAVMVLMHNEMQILRRTSEKIV